MISDGKRESTVAQAESNRTGPGTQAVAAMAQEAGAENDEDLARKAALGNTDAFDVLVLRYQDRVFNMLTRLCGSADEAEDLAQETFLKTYRALGTFRQGCKFYTWLFRIAVNTAYSRRRQVTRIKSHEGARLDAPAAGGSEEGNLGDVVAGNGDCDPAEQAERENVRQRVREGLEKIEPDYRSILLLRDMEGMDYDAIADALSITRAAVKSRLHRARKEMARILKDLRD